MAKRKNHAPGFKDRTVLAVLPGSRKVAGLNTGYGMRQTRLRKNPEKR